MITKELMIEESEITLQELISSSTLQHTKVYRGLVRGNNVAVKVISINGLDTKQIESMIKEVLILANLRAPNILLLMGICKTPTLLYIVTELMQTSVYQILKQHQVNQNSQINNQDTTDTNPNHVINFIKSIEIAKEILLALNWVHKSSILHLNLKPANILLDAKGHIKLTDFTNSKILNNNNLLNGNNNNENNNYINQFGSVSYTSPEILLNKEYNEKSDVYSFGITLWSMVSQSNDPYSNRFKSYNEMVKGITEQHIRPEINPNWPDKLKDLLKICWHRDPNARPKWDELLECNQLDQILIDYTLGHDLDTYSFWRTQFQSNVKVELNHFLDKLNYHLNFKQLQLQLLQIQNQLQNQHNNGHHSLNNNHLNNNNNENQELALIYQDNFKKMFKELLKIKTISTTTKSVKVKQYVTLESLGKFTNWFGPIIKDAGNSVLERMVELCSTHGFYGDLTTAQVNTILMKPKSGSYILRFSSSEPTCYTISFVQSHSQQNFTHLKFLYSTSRKGYYFQGSDNYYPTISSLIESKPKILKEPIIGGDYMCFQIDMSTVNNGLQEYITIPMGRFPNV